MVYKTIFISFLLVLVITPSIFAQYGAPQTTDSCSSHMWTFIGVGSAVLITAVLFHNDQQIYDNLYSWKMNNKFVKDASPVITNLGNGMFSVGLFGGFAGYGLVFNDKKAFEVGKIGFESFLLTGVTVQLFKNLCGVNVRALPPGPADFGMDRLHTSVNRKAEKGYLLLMPFLRDTRQLSLLLLRPLLISTLSHGYLIFVTRLRQQQQLAE